VKKMSLLKGLPKEIEKDNFKDFLEKIKKDFPANEFPELFIHYQETDGKILILGIGKSNECAKQVAKAWEKDPELKKLKLSSTMIRAPKKKFILR